MLVCGTCGMVNESESGLASMAAYMFAKSVRGGSLLGGGGDGEREEVLDFVGTV